MRIFKNLKTELEKPRHQRPFGSGWLSGSGAILCGLVSICIILIIRFPNLLQTPELQQIHASGYLQSFLHFVLLLGYVFALLSLLLSQRKLLGFSALGLIIAASFIGSTNIGVPSSEGKSIYFGLDFFVINLLFVGFLFVPLERIFPKKSEQIVFRPEWQEDMFYYLVSSMLVQILTFITMAPSSLLKSIFDFGGLASFIGNIPFLIQVIIIMIITDFLQYWIHRAFHKIPFLWKFHAVHHSAEHMDWLAGSRLHIVEIAIVRGLTATPMFSLGFDPTAIQTYVLIVFFYSTLIHANINWKFPVLEKFLVTPRFHHWHHGKELEAIDVNFAIHFTLYDRLFGTHHLPKNRWPKNYGIQGEKVPGGYWKQFSYPFRQKN